MSRLPRILPLVGVAVGGVLAINALAGAQSFPNMFSGARAWAEEAVKPPAKAAKGKADAKAKADKAAADKAASAPADPDAIAPSMLGQSPAPTGQPADASAVAAGAPPPAARPICAPTAAELAKQAGLSPAELQQLQNLGARRTQLDQREQDLSTQLALLSAAEAKVDAKMKALTGLKADITGLLSQADGREATEVERLVKVFEGMKPKDAAARMAILEDSVRLPIAAKMKERALSAVIGQMSPGDAKKLTESLAKRFSAAQTLAQNADKAEAAAAPPAPPSADPNAKPAAPKKARPKQAAAAPRKKAPADAQAAATPPAAAPPAAAPAPTKAAAAAPPAGPAAAPAKAG